VDEDTVGTAGARKALIELTVRSSPRNQSGPQRLGDLQHHSVPNVGRAFSGPYAGRSPRQFALTIEGCVLRFIPDNGDLPTCATQNHIRPQSKRV
jgi:hypothetical protein